MSSETSTREVRLKADGATDPGLQPWQFFVLAALGCATAVTFIARGHGPAVIILLGILMATAALVGYAALRMLRPRSADLEKRRVSGGQRQHAPEIDPICALQAAMEAKVRVES